MTETIITVVIAVLGSNGLFALIQYIISRKDRKNDRLKAIDERLAQIEKRQNRQEVDACRQQLLTLMSDYHDDKAEILRLAEHYFSDLKGDWYMTDIFSKFLEKNKINVPLWFKLGGS